MAELLRDSDPLFCLLTSWSRVPLEKLTSFQLVKKFPACYGTRRFRTAFTSAHHLSLYWPSTLQSTFSPPTSWRSILILSSLLCLGLPSDLLPRVFLTKSLHTPLLSPICTTCPTHLMWSIPVINGKLPKHFIWNIIVKQLTYLTNC